MLSFLNMEPLKIRQVDRFVDGNLVVSTVAVNDGDKPYETAVSHPGYDEYFNGTLASPQSFLGKRKWCVVEAYDSREEAEKGHARWVERMTSLPLPEVLNDCQNSKISQLAYSIEYRLRG